MRKQRPGKARNGTCGIAALALAGAVAGCTGTPMPIPPSLESERLELESFREEYPCLGEECALLVAAEGATEPNAVVIAHRLGGFDIPEPFEPMVETTRADEAGGFGVLFQGTREGLYRLIIQGDSGALARNLAAVPGDPDTPWPVVAVEDEWPESCLAIVPDAIDFGDVVDGDAATAVVELENRCDAPLFLVELFVTGEPEGVIERSFGVLPQAPELEPRGVTPAVVAFWPRDPLEFRGALIVQAEEGPIPGVQIMSIPVRGRATARE